jgi:PQQ system protein
MPMAETAEPSGLNESLASYLRLLRPGQYEEIDEQFAKLLNELPGLDKQNKAVVGRMIVHGGVGYAKEDLDGRLHAQIRIPLDEFVYEPSIIVVPRGGDIALEMINDDHNDHSALLPSNGDKQLQWMPAGTRGTATINLNSPGMYWFGSSVLGNDEGRGLVGVIAVLGNVSEEAQQDRPPQPQT